MYHMEYFTTKYSLFLVPTYNVMKELEKIDEYLKLLNDSNVGKYIKLSIKNNGRNGYNPFNLFAAILFCFSESIYSLRDIEKTIKFDLRLIYIMEQEQPSHNAIKEVINKYILPYKFEIFTTITKQIINKFKLDITCQYLDGTKIEANSNKYKFVWKPTKFHKKLDIKIKKELKKLNINFDENTLIISKYLYDFLKKYAKDYKININKIPRGKGKRLTSVQKEYKILYSYLLKLLEYEEKEKICGSRNSYFKTDKDATAMVLKEDYYSKNSHDFHAGYNIQVMVSSGLITMFGVFQDRTDYHTLIPMNNNYYRYYNEYPKNECADSGYGIYENYLYLKKHNINNYIKFQSWSGESSGKNPQIFSPFLNTMICLNNILGVPMQFENNRHPKYKNSKLYKFEGCNNCGYAYLCKKKLKNKNENFRIYEINIENEHFKQEVRNNLLSPKGVEIRVNRSIQVEGTFGQIKENMDYNRIKRRGLEKVSCEIMLICLGRNIRKFYNLLNSNNIKSYYWKNKSKKKEIFNLPKEKKTE